MTPSQVRTASNLLDQLAELEAARRLVPEGPVPFHRLTLNGMRGEVPAAIEIAIGRDLALATLKQASDDVIDRLRKLGVEVEP